jgi:hypothetical protein
LASAVRALHEVRCHKCSRFVGESDCELDVIAIVKERELREAVALPRVSYTCKCGWVSVFRPLRK